MRKSERNKFYDDITKLKEKNNYLTDEWLEVYKCLYPDNEAIVEQIGKEAGLTKEGIKFFLTKYNHLDIMRT